MQPTKTSPYYSTFLIHWAQLARGAWCSSSSSYLHVQGPECLVGPTIENIKLSLLFIASFNKVSKEIFELHVAEVQTNPRMDSPIARLSTFLRGSELLFFFCTPSFFHRLLAIATLLGLIVTISCCIRDLIALQLELNFKSILSLLPQSTGLALKCVLEIRW